MLPHNIEVLLYLISSVVSRHSRSHSRGAGRCDEVSHLIQEVGRRPARRSRAPSYRLRSCSEYDDDSAVARPGALHLIRAEAPACTAGKQRGGRCRHRLGATATKRAGRALTVAITLAPPL